MADAHELYRAGKLAEAAKAQAAQVKEHPTDSSRRGFLVELLLFSGELERADTHLDALGRNDPQSMPGVALLRQLVRAETARRQYHVEGRIPEVLREPTPWMRAALEASAHVRAGDAGKAAELLRVAEDLRPRARGTCDGKAFEDIRDLDDLTAGVFEVLTSTGKYYWIPPEAVSFIEFREPERPRDLLWRRAHMAVRDGPDGEVFLPAVYAPAGPVSDGIRMGRVTEWMGGEGAPVRGLGQRTFLVGEEDRTIMELKKIEFEEPAAGGGAPG